MSPNRKGRKHDLQFRYFPVFVFSGHIPALCCDPESYSLVLFLDPDTNKETYTGLFFILKEKHN
jgi:hypothetical protein